MNIAEASSHHVVMEAHDDVSGTTGVAHVTFDVDQAFIDHLLKVQKLCLEHDFTQTRNWYEPTQWSDAEGQSIANALSSNQLTGTELVISTESFWLCGVTRDGARLESEMMDIAGFMEEQQALTCKPE